MKWVLLSLVLLGAGCVSSEPDAQSIPDEMIRSSFAGAQAYSTEHGSELVNSDWLDQGYNTTEEPGAWLEQDQESILVTLELTQTSHASGLVHHLLAVFDPETNQRRTPVFHYIADHLNQRSTHRFAERDSVLYIGYVQQGPYVRHVTGQLRFDHKSLYWDPAEIDSEVGRINLD